MKRVIIEIFILLVFSASVIFFQFNQMPKKLSWDEVEFTRLALSLDNKPYTPYSQLATGHSTLYFYILLFSFKIFSVTNFALRFPSALFGVINVLLFYTLAKIVFQKLKYFKKSFLNVRFKSYLPLLLSLIFVTTRWYFNFARFSFEVTFLLFLELASIYFLLKFFSSSHVIPILSLSKGRNLATKGSAIHFGMSNVPSLDFSVTEFISSFIERLLRNDKLLLVLSSIFSGLAFLSYYPGRIFFLLPLIFIVFYSRKKFVKRNIIVFLFIVFLIVSPLLTYIATHRDLRIQEQLFLIDKKLTTQKRLDFVGENIVKLTKMFNIEGDFNGRHNYPGKPMLNPVVGAFFILGFLVTILNLKIFFNQFFLLYFFISLAPAIFTYPIENPNSLRTYTAIVPVIYFLGNGVIYLLQSEQKSKRLLFAVIFFLIICFALSSVYDLRTYFRYQQIVFKKAFELNGRIQKILNLRLWEKIQSL